jgi:hypothetical protein
MDLKNHFIHMLINMTNLIALLLFFIIRYKLAFMATLFYLLFCTGVKLGLSTLMEEHRLKTSGNEVPRKIFLLEREVVTG